MEALAVILQFTLFLGACIGHVALLTYSLNWFYSQPWPRPLLHWLRFLHAALVPAGPLFFWWLDGFDLVSSFNLQPTFGSRALVTAYLLICWIAGFGVLPAVTLWRLFRRPPKALLSSHTQTVNVAERLGYAPVGRGKYRHFCRLPGNEVFRVDITERILQLPRLPQAWDGLTILHLSDLHMRGSPDRAFFQHVMDLCRAEEPDLVAITGDIVDSHKHHRWVVPVLRRLRWKSAAFAVLGNHDFWHDPALVRRRLRRAGVQVLGNGWQELDVRGQPLVVIGNECPWFQPGPDLANCPTGAFRLCLSHTPDNLPWGRQQNIDLMLAGHNHGGQIRVPVIGSIFVPSRFSRRYDCGVFYEPPTLLHVSRGLGGQQPLRYGCRPEVTRIVLRAAPAISANAAATAVSAAAH